MLAMWCKMVDRDRVRGDDADGRQLNCLEEFLHGSLTCAAITPVISPVKIAAWSGDGAAGKAGGGSGSA